MDADETRKLFEIKQTEESIRQEFKDSFSVRAERYLQVKPHGIIPNKYFAGPSSECSLLFRDGHYYGCIALVQAVAEALVRFIYQVNFPGSLGEFEDSVRKLAEGGHITIEAKDAFLKIWQRRNDYHHLNSTIETDRERLKSLALEKIRLLNQIEREIFGFKTNQRGEFIPDHPQYWDDTGGQVYLRLDP